MKDKQEPQPEVRQKIPDAKGFLEAIMKTDNPDLWKLIALMLPENATPDNPRNIFLTTEWPNANYTKQITKLATHFSTVKHTLGYDEIPVRDMRFYFAEAMVSHRRGREKNVLSAMKGSDGTTIIDAGKSRSKRLFG